ncbi:MAG: peptidyl-prolyl cis-trans isomerase [Ignavibacteriaceae bacterium]
MELKKYLVFLILFLAIAGCSKNTSNVDDEIVARIGKDYDVTLNELKQYASDRHYDRRFRDKSEAYKNALNALIIGQLKIFDFFDRKLNENQDVMKKISRVVNNELINKYYDKEFMEKFANEKKAAEAYKAMEKEIIYNEIILPIPENSTKEILDSLKATAIKIEDGLSKNYDINGLIQIYSLKNPIINNQKKLTWSQSIMDPVGDVIFNLKKGFTRVIVSKDGYHIVKVSDIKKIKLEPIAKIKDKIISQLKTGYYWAYNNEYDKFRNELIDKSSIKWNQKGLDQIVKWSKNDKFYAGVYKDTIQNAILNGRNFEIMSYNNGNIDLGEYLRLLEEVVILSPNTVLTSQFVKKFILDAVYDDNVVKAAKKLGLEKELINPETKDPLIKDRLIYLYNQAVIEASIPETTPEALHKFYEDHKDSIFYQLKVVYIYARVYSDSAKAAADINEIKKGTPFEKVNDAWLVKMFIRNRDGSLKAYRTAGGDYLAKAAFKLNLNESAGPIEYNDSSKGKQFAVIKCFKIQPEKQLTYDDVKGKRIEEEFKNYYRKKNSDELEVMLKKKYNVRIFENVLSEAIASK